MRMSCYKRIRQVNAHALGVDATTPQGECILSKSTPSASALICLISRGQAIRIYWPNPYTTTDQNFYKVLPFIWVYFKRKQSI